MRAFGRHWIACLGVAALLSTMVGVGLGAGIAAQKPSASAKAAAAKLKAAPAPASPTANAGLDTPARHALIVEADTGTVLFDKQGEERMPPASMSKMMTAYVAFDMLKAGKISLGDELPVSEKAWKLGGSKMFVGIGARIKVDDLLKGMLVQSGNDACVVLAEGLAGSEQDYVDLMNQKAKEIGLMDSHFANVTGLPDPNEWMTAHDLVTLGTRITRDFPEYYHYFSERTFDFNNIDQGNRNPLLYKVAGADGLKTGHTDESGYSLIGSVLRGDRRVIVVVAGLASMRDRASEGERLVEWAFREFNDYKLLGAGEKVDDAEIWLGNEPKVGMTVRDDLVVTLPRHARRDMKVSVVYDKPVPAPVKQGDQIGKIVVNAPDMPPIERPLYAAKNVRPISTIGRMATLAGYLIWGNRR
ncbi:MAG TPA: D-alanyl-D-alanine carboxypeptidase family protein [Stellaceae bacterium]|nr:D-alanyl-D-alanine carboxypeptidase family protein [Stellaceae bacterium]